MVLLISCWVLFSCVGVSNEIQYDFVAQLQKKEERSQAQKKIRSDQKKKLQQEALQKWELLASCQEDASPACMAKVREYVAQYEYAVVESMSINNQDIVSTPMDIPHVQEAKKWIQVHDSLWPEEKKIAQRYNMKRISADVFVMGCQVGDSRCNEDEFPPHVVTLSKDFYIGTTEVTQEVYTSVMGVNPSRFRNCGPTCPVESVRFFDAVQFLNALSDRDSLPRCYLGNPPEVEFIGLHCKGYRLPSEAEWEYAARSTGMFLFAGSDVANEVGWTKSNAQERTHPVGQKKPNQLGLYDMSGNVLEWCTDWYWEYTAENQIDPVRQEQTESKVGRGGSWFEDGLQSRISDRYYEDPKFQYDLLGFRVAQTAFE